MSRLAPACLALLAASFVCAQAADTATKPADPAEVASSVTMPDTLMFTIDELNEIQSRIGTGGGDGADGGQQRAPIESATLYLSTILYYGRDDWTVWINDVAISPRQEFKQFEVTNITPTYVELLVPLSAQGMRPVRLSPNQTFVAKSGTVVEGRWNP